MALDDCHVRLHASYQMSFKALDFFKKVQFSHVFFVVAILSDLFVINTGVSKDVQQWQQCQQPGMHPCRHAGPVACNRFHMPMAISQLGVTTQTCR